MLRSILSLRPTLHHHHHRRSYRIGTMSDVLHIVGPFDGILPSPSAALHKALLRRCIRSNDTPTGNLLHARLIKSGFNQELLISNVLLDMYSKLGFIEGCLNLFDEMPHRDIVSWCTLISGFVTHGFYLEAYRFFKRLLWSDMRPNHFVVSSVLKGCSGSEVLDLGVTVHCLVMKCGLGFDRFVEIGIVDMYAKCGCLDVARKVFYEIPVKCTVAWNAMISGFVRSECYDEAVELCREMRQAGCGMDLVTLRVVASAGCALEMVGLCKNLHVYSIKVGFDGDCFFAAELVRLLSKLGEVAYMGKLFDRVRRPDASLYSLLISGYHLHGHRVEAVRLAEQLLRLELKPEQGALVSVLNLCLCREEGMQIHDRVLKTGHSSYVSVNNALISMYIRFKEMVDADTVFIGMPVRDVVSWTALMSGLVQNLRFGEALENFYAFKETGIPLDQHSVATTINACAGLQSIVKGKQIHCLSLKLGFASSDFLNASLLHMYAKCGFIETASWLFSHVSSHDLILTNVMLAGYCWNSVPDKALELFGRQYRSGLVPDHFSFSTVLNACADTRKLEVGRQIHCCLSKSGFEFSDLIIGNAVINMYVKSGSIIDACRFFYSMGRRNVNSYSMLMLAYIQNRGSSEALQLFYQMQQMGLRANTVTFARILRGCADLSEVDLGKQVHASIIKIGLISDVYIENALIGMYAKYRDTGKRKESITEMPVRDDVLHNSVIAGYPEQGKNYATPKAFELFKLDDYFTYADVSNFGVAAAFEVQERSVLPHVVQSGLCLDISVGNSMVEEHSNCSSSGISGTVLNGMLPREVVFWNYLISENAQHGSGNIKCLK